MKQFLCIVLFSMLFYFCDGQNIDTISAPLADTVAVDQVGERIMETTVSIYNASNSEISFVLGDLSTNLDTFRLKKSEVWYSPAYNFDPVLKIQTQKTIKTYQLRLGDSYMIFWNKKMKYWDLTKTN